MGRVPWQGQSLSEQRRACKPLAGVHIGECHAVATWGGEGALPSLRCCQKSVWGRKELAGLPSASREGVSGYSAPVGRHGRGCSFPQPATCRGSAGTRAGAVTGGSAGTGSVA